MKIKNVFLASLLTKLGHEVKAELIVDDANGTSLTFPDITDIAEIAVGVAVDAPDGTYTIADGADALTVVVMGGAVTDVTTGAPAATTAEVAGELDAEVAAVLEVVIEQVQALKAENATVKAELKGLKASLKHSEEPTKPTTASTVPQFKLVD